MDAGYAKGGMNCSFDPKKHVLLCIKLKRLPLVLPVNLAREITVQEFTLNAVETGWDSCIKGMAHKRKRKEATHIISSSFSPPSQTAIAIAVDEKF